MLCIFHKASIDSDTVMFHLVGTQSVLDHIKMSEFKYSIKERYATIYFHMFHPETIYINTHLVPNDGGYWYTHKMTVDD